MISQFVVFWVFFLMAAVAVAIKFEQHKLLNFQLSRLLQGVLSELKPHLG